MPADPGPPFAADVAVQFLLEADATPGLLPRLMQPFARRDLIPDQVHAHRCGETLRISLILHAMPAESVSLVERNLGQIIGVRQVTRSRPMRRHAA